MIFGSRSLVGAPGRRFPKAVWFLGARAFANIIPGLTLRGLTLCKHCHRRCLQANPSKTLGFHKSKSRNSPSRGNLALR